MTPARFRATRTIRNALIFSLLGATALGAAGRFAGSLALTMGSAVAIVSALWLSDLVGNLRAPVPGVETRLDWKFWLEALFRYVLVGSALYGAVRALPAEIPWLLVGLSTVVAALVLECVQELRKQPVEGQAGTAAGTTARYIDK